MREHNLTLDVWFTISLSTALSLFMSYFATWLSAFLCIYGSKAIVCDFELTDRMAYVSHQTAEQHYCAVFLNSAREDSACSNRQKWTLRGPWRFATFPSSSRRTVDLHRRNKKRWAPVMFFFYYHFEYMRRPYDCSSTAHGAFVSVSSMRCCSSLGKCN